MRVGHFRPPVSKILRNSFSCPIRTAPDPFVQIESFYFNKLLKLKNVFSSNEVKWGRLMNTWIVIFVTFVVSKSIFLTYQTTKMTSAFDQLSFSLLCFHLCTKIISKSETRMKIFYETEKRFLINIPLNRIGNFSEHQPDRFAGNPSITKWGLSFLFLSKSGHEPGSFTGKLDFSSAILSSSSPGKLKLRKHF